MTKTPITIHAIYTALYWPLQFCTNLSYQFYRSNLLFKVQLSVYSALLIVLKETSYCDGLLWDNKNKNNNANIINQKTTTADATVYSYCFLFRFQLCECECECECIEIDCNISNSSHYSTLCLSATSASCVRCFVFVNKRLKGCGGKLSQSFFLGRTKIACQDASKRRILVIASFLFKAKSFLLLVLKINR